MWSNILTAYFALTGLGCVYTILRTFYKALARHAARSRDADSKSLSPSQQMQRVFQTRDIIIFGIVLLIALLNLVLSIVLKPLL